MRIRHAPSRQGQPVGDARVAHEGGTRIANSAIDGVRPQGAAGRDDIVKYAASDLVCYRAPQPEALVRRQAELWDPILAWSRDELGASFVVADGIMPVAQPEAATAAV